MEELLKNKPINVLIIEDNFGDYILIEEVIMEVEEQKKHLTFRLQHANCFEKGKELLEDQVFDIVLLDLSLPEYSGLETIEMFKKLWPTQPVFILTGLNDEAMIEKAEQLGVDGYFSKGYSTVGIVAAEIEKLLAQSP